jgi:1-acyl-sn-glycerol-3-phosphate acyltransferase
MEQAAAMIARLNYYWRLVATGGCFAAFGFGGLALSTFVFPVLLLTPRETRTVRARWLIHKSFGLFMGMMEFVGIMRLEVNGAEKLRNCRNMLVLASHPTLIDVVALISLMPGANCVVKRALWNNPFLAGVVRAANYVSNSDPEHMIDDCAAVLDDGSPLIIFPEGTRTAPGKPLHFLRGAAYIALKSGAPVLPVVIHCTPSTLTKRERWYQIPSRRYQLRVDVLDPLPCSRWISADEPQTVAARKLTRMLESHFTQEIETHGRFANAQA